MNRNVNHILIVDDDKTITEFLSTLLREENYRVTIAHRGADAIKMVNEIAFDLIILDVRMPEMDGFETCKILKSSPRTQNVPVIFLTSLTDTDSKISGLEVGASDFLSKPVDFSELKLRVKNMLKINEYSKFLKSYNQILEEKVQQKTKDLKRAYQDLDIAHKQIKVGYIDTIYRLTLAAEYKDRYTANHLKRISEISAYFARQLGLDEKEIENIYFASPMHDIGKIAISDAILLKPSALTYNEYVKMQDHTIIGKELLQGSDSEILKLAELIAATHHEKFNGHGYPNGLNGDDIPIVGRIVMIVDVYDALRSHRPYKDGLSHAKTIEIIRKGDRKTKNEDFDPKLREALLDLADDLDEIYEQLTQDNAPVQAFL